MKRTLLLLLLVTAMPFLLFAGTNTSLSLDSGAYIYQILDYAELKGIIPKIKQEKPYVNSLVYSNLQLILEQDDKLTDSELKIINNYLDNNEIDGGFAFSAVAESDNNLLLSDLSHPHSINGLGLQVEGDVFDFLSLNVVFSMLLDRTNEEAFIPYSFYKTWDHHHMDPETRVDSSTEEFAISNRSSEELAAATEDGSAYVRIGRFNRNWGPGEHSLLLSDTARPFIGLESGFPLSDLAYITTVTGSLGSTVGADTSEEQKMLSAHRLTIYPADWLSFAFYESVVFGKRFELAYISPISIYMVSQMGTAGDRDNSTMGLEFELNPVNWFNVYGEFFVDEIEHDKFDQLFTYVKNIFAYKAGVEAPVPVLPFAVARFQYTKLEPYVYTHYAESRYYFAYNQEININYTNDGACIGYPLQPNSDQFLVNFSFIPAAGFEVDVDISYIRHGDNPDAEDDEYLIMGDIDEDLDYSNVDEYPEKDFLNDGIYEKILSFAADVSYTFKKVPVSLNLGYGFAWSRNYNNIEGNTNFKNIITIGGSYKQQLW
ncbi:MAG: capsule assembly Wzi family protein [Spirochaetales bacterium]|uniref:Capsule assembly Wzi family protein n=1 Tax=Candidatus Thalassospirochaeta sargassi TaxID=3119039 RepID=A0AAJ1MK82_9SPIO|nr:capsule assembly Wzi family protein [Spirochaetales bacterium]